MRHTSHIRIDLNAIASNVRTIQASLGSECQLCPVVKADAYGLGARRVARALVSAGVRRLAVFTPEQAIALEEVAPNVSILVLMPVRELPHDPAIARLVASGRLELVVVDHEQVVALSGIRVGRPLRVHVEVDCGIGRSGVAPERAAALIEDVRSRRSLQLAGVFTHFSTHAPDAVRAQAALFDGVLQETTSLRTAQTIIHAASSGSCFTTPDQRRDMVRVGLGWTGWLPCDQDDPSASHARALGLRGVASWASSIVQIREVPAGTPVGYGGQWRAKHTTRLGLVPVGYADGFPSLCRDVANPHCVVIETRDGLQAAPVVGAVSMDQLMIDLTQIDPSESLRGREVVLLSDQHDSAVSLHRLAERAGLPPHALLTALGDHVPRVYLTDRVDAQGGLAPITDPGVPESVPHPKMVAG